MSEGLLGFLRLLGAGSVGALIVFVLGWYKDVRAERLRRSNAYLQDQLHYLYGPLYFFISQNQQLLEHSSKITKEYFAYFDGKKWSAEAMKGVEEQAKATISLSNRYVERVRDNNRAIVDVLRTQWHLIDDDDIELLSAFQVHVIRDVEESTDNRLKDVPFPLILKLGDVKFYDSEWANRVQQKWSSKREELREFERAGRSLHLKPN